MLVVNPSRDKVSQDGPRSPAPSKTEENPFPHSDALSEKQVGAPAIKQSRRKKKMDYLRKAMAFMRQWNSSNGFDLDDPPIDLLDGPCIVKEVDMNRCRSDDPCMKCVKFALESENADKNSILELVRIVKYNIDFELQGKMYYLTFIAKDKEGREDVYQAKVLSKEKKDEDEDEEEEEKVQVRNKYVHNKLVDIEEEGDEEYEYDSEDDEEEDEDKKGVEEEDGGEDGEEEEEEEEDDEVEEDEKEDRKEEDDEVEEDEKEDRKEEDEKEDRKGEDEKDCEGNQEMEVLIFRKKFDGDQESKAVMEKHERGVKRCNCGQTKEDCGKGGRNCNCGSY